VLIHLQGVGEYISHILVRMHVGVINDLVGMQIATNVKANIHILYASFDDSSCDVSKYSQIVAIDQEQ
jgi:hypothetical protein